MILFFCWGSGILLGPADVIFDEGEFLIYLR